MPTCIPANAGKPYRPSNGTEGEIFTLMHCKHCAHGRAAECEIETAAMIFSVGEPDYPKEWVYDAEGHPTCTGFVMSKPQEAGRCAGTIDMFEGDR